MIADSRIALSAEYHAAVSTSGGVRSTSDTKPRTKQQIIASIAADRTIEFGLYI